MKIKFESEVEDIQKLKSQLLQWSEQFEQVVWLDSNAYADSENTYQAILAVGAKRVFQTDSNKALEELKSYREKNKGWLFGYFSFDVERKDKVDCLNFPKIYFFSPQKLFFIKENSVEIQYVSEKENEIEREWQAIKRIPLQEYSKSNLGLEIKSRLTKQEYLIKVRKIQEYIQQGIIDEVNFCQEFYTNARLERPLKTYEYLNSISKTPFAAYLRIGDKYILCASPERYLSHRNSKIKSQPIKGTAKRKQSALEDKKVREKLEKEEKEIIENTIITEMIARELKTISKEGSVQITELCKLYTFEQVHQLISTVVGELRSDLDVIDIIKATSPMGSMTGIPKQESLKIIEELESFNRGVYSGSIGYFAPNDDFDFNVVIRSILYNAENNYVSFSAGGAITALSQPELEYEECRVKTKAMEQVLGRIIF